MSSFTQLSPAVITREIDLTNTVPNVGASGGAFVGEFAWGPVEKYTDLSNENELLAQFHKPNDTNFVDWFSVSSFLSYTGNIKIVRVVDEDALNSTDDGTGILVKNSTHYEIVNSSNPGIYFASKYPGKLGDSISISMCDSRNFQLWPYKGDFDFAPGTSDSAEAVGASNDELHIVVIDRLGLFSGVPGSVLEHFPFVSKALDAKDANNAPNYYVNVLNRNSQYVWGFKAIDGALVSATVSGTDSVASVTIGGSGGTGYTTAPTVTFATPPVGGIRATGIATVSGGVVTGITITNPGAGYSSVPSVTLTGGGGTGATATAVMTAAVTNAGTAWGSTLQVAGVASEFATLVATQTFDMSGGADSTNVAAQEIITGLEMFQNAEEVDVSLIFLGDSGGQASHTAVTQYAIDDIAESRQDVIVFFSPTLDDVLNKTQSDAANSAVLRRNTVARSSSYAVMDSGWKLMYDVYNDKYRWIPLNADIAGLCAQVDTTNDPWWSPGGYNRGRLKNVVSLAFNPNKQSRDTLYKVGVNPVVTFTTDGTILYGDKTLQGKQSAFSQIGIRRLFILLRKAISNAAKYFLFEFNDQFTRAQFRAMVEPYLREVKGRRGMDDFKVVCDTTNNTPEVIMRGEFVGSIFIKPQYSIQWITLNFVAVRRDVSFEEVAGAI